jgi:uncharacterized membrane protein (UPF0136 family)
MQQLAPGWGFSTASLGLARQIVRPTYYRKESKVKIVGIVLIVFGLLAAAGAIQRSAGVESYAVPAILVLLGVGAIAQARAKKRGEKK